MRNVVLLQWLSLDGVAEEPSDWFFDDGPELFDTHRPGARDAGRGPPGPRHLRLLGRLLADVRRRAVRVVHQHHAQARRHLERSHRALEQHRPHDVTGRRLRATAEAAVGRRHRHPRQHRTRPILDRRAARRRAATRDAADDRRPRQAPLLRPTPTMDLQQFELVDVEQTPKGTLFLHYRSLAPS